MRIYLAAPFPARDEAKVVRNQLQASGHEVTSSWLDTHLPNDAMTEAQQRQEAEEDLADIEGSDVLVIMTDHLEWSTGGVHFEAGFAEGSGIPIIVLGCGWTLFLAQYLRVDDVNALLDALDEMVEV